MPGTSHVNIARAELSYEAGRGAELILEVEGMWRGFIPSSESEVVEAG